MAMHKRTPRGTWIVVGCLWLAAVAVAMGQAPVRGTNAHADAVELLRRVIKEQQQNPGRIVRTPTVPGAAVGSGTAPAGPRPDRAELERQFLDGRITAKQFQRALEDLEKNPPPPPVPVKPAAVAKTGPKEPALSPKGVSNLPGRVITNAPTTVISTPEDAPEHKTLSDVEAKIDAILARRQAQLEAAKTNANAASLPAGPQTKRQKLDSLLRALIQGKMTEPEYNAAREKVMAQPD